MYYNGVLAGRRCFGLASIAEAKAAPDRI